MKEKQTSDILLAIIRAHCLECSGGSRLEVKHCRVPDCKLYPYRMCPDQPKKRKKKKNEQITVYDLMQEIQKEDTKK